MSVEAALIQVVGVIGAALAAIYLWRHRASVEKDLERRAERLRREEHVRETLLGIRAEITVELRTLAKQFDPAKAAAAKTALVAALREDKLRGKPAVPLYAFEDIKSEHGLLPVACIEHTVEFYKNNSRLDSLLTAFAAGDYSGLDAVRGEKAIDELMELGEDTLRSGLAAKRAINLFLAETHRIEERWTEDEENVWKRLLAKARG